MATDIIYECKKIIGRSALPADLVTKSRTPGVYWGDLGFMVANDATIATLDYLIMKGDARKIRGSLDVNGIETPVTKYELTRKGLDSVA
ncbi:MAG: hypothetical protein NT016_03840 [Candidatus Aenigmarchaeota archaeon]|nr:hypothetical protein [Candidatus Aenigmarchaeota archaeon]